MERSSRIYIAGNRGMVGSALVRSLTRLGYENLIYTPRPEYDLTEQSSVAAFFEREKPEYVIIAAARVGGIVANNRYRAQFIYENLMIQNNIIHHSYLHDVKKLLFLGSSCIYPKNCPQPMKEEYLLTDELEYTNEPYAIAKIAGIKMCESYNIQYGTNFISVMPTNLYGPNDNYNLETSHVMPALIRKMHIGKCLENNDWESLRADLDKSPIEGFDGSSGEDDILRILEKYGIRRYPASLTLWGSGTPYREFMHVDDMAGACLFIMNNIDFKDLVPPGHDEGLLRNTHLNIGTGNDLTIKELAYMIRKITAYNGQIHWDESKPDGTFRKLLDVSRLNSLGWQAGINLEDGIRAVYDQYKS